MSEPRVALLIDGDNLSPLYATSILAVARMRGHLSFCRAYLRAGSENSGWITVPGVDAQMSGKSKNAADFRLSFEAVELEARGGYEVFVIGSNDSDLAHIIAWLREKGKRVVTVSQKAMCPTLRKAGGEPVVLGAPDKGLLTSPEVSDPIRALIAENGGVIPMTLFGALMRQRYGMTSKSAGARNWMTFFRARAEEFALTGEPHQLMLSMGEGGEP